MAFTWCKLHNFDRLITQFRDNLFTFWHVARVQCWVHIVQKMLVYVIWKMNLTSYLCIMVHQTRLWCLMYFYILKAARNDLIGSICYLFNLENESNKLLTMVHQTRLWCLMYFCILKAARNDLIRYLPTMNVSLELAYFAFLSFFLTIVAHVFSQGSFKNYVDMAFFDHLITHLSVDHDISDPLR